MPDDIAIETKADYLLVTISDNVITTDRALEILNFIAEQSDKFNHDKVLLDERTVQQRDVTSTDILKLSIEMAKKGLHKIYIAFWCKEELINNHSDLLKLFTQTHEYVIQHFSEQDAAIDWLNSKNQG